MGHCSGGWRGEQDPASRFFKGVPARGESYELFQLWYKAGRRDDYIGTLVYACLARGGRAKGIRAGEAYVDVGTIHGYREAAKILSPPLKEEVL